MDHFLDSKAEIHQFLGWVFGKFKTSKSHSEINWPLKTLKLQMHTTLDPYNTTEEVELTFNNLNSDWTNGQFKILADEMNLFVRTASKYDDCQLMVTFMCPIAELTWVVF